jgi:hypothetical protein
MDGMFETCHLAGYEKNKTPPSIGFKVQRFPAALQFDSLPSGIQVGEGNWRRQILPHFLGVESCRGHALCSIQPLHWAQ